MKCYVLSALALTLSFFASPSYAANEVTDKSTGISFPEHVTFIVNDKEYQLQATGVATRKKLVIKVYSIASYLQDGVAAGQDKIQTILNDDYAKQLSIKWARDVPVAKIQEVYKESLGHSFPSASAAVQSDINKFLSFYSQDAKKGDEHILRWAPGGIVEVSINGNKMGTISDVEFAKGLWSIWFGPHSVVDKDNLISLLH